MLPFSFLSDFLLAHNYIPLTVPTIIINNLNLHIVSSIGGLIGSPLGVPELLLGGVLVLQGHRHQWVVVKALLLFVQGLRLSVEIVLTPLL